MAKSIFFPILFFLIYTTTFGQLIEDFTDGEITSNPAWTGELGAFTVNGLNQLQLNATVAGESYISTPCVLSSLQNTTWNIQIRLNFSPSTSNLVKIYLVSDQSNLEGPLNGYYLQIGETGSGDVVRLFRQSGSTRTNIASATTNVAINPNVDVRVQRDATGLWSIFVKTATGGTFGSAESTVTDVTHNTSAHFGIVAEYTISNIKNFFWDNITVTSPPDVSKPSVTGISVLNAQAIRISYTEDLLPASVTVPGNVIASDGLHIPALVSASGSALTAIFTQTFTGNFTYTLTLNGITDLAGNTQDEFVGSFMYTLTTPSSSAVIPYRAVVINEIMADLSPLPVGLPPFEYMELYNTTHQTISLQGVILQDGGVSRPIPSGTSISGHGYLVIVGSASALQAYRTQFPSVPSISISGFGLTDGGESQTLFAESGSIIDAISYNTSWYKNSVKDDGGWALEQINPNTSCTGDFNWSSAVTLSGVSTTTGTPGMANSILSSASDTQAPQITSLKILNLQEILLSFSEPMDTQSVKTAVYTLSTSQSVSGTPKIISSINGVFLQFSTALDTTTAFTITLTGAKDCSGNVLSPNFISFMPLRNLSYRQITINEIMADISPAPSRLPAFEYLELYNTLNEPVLLNGFILKDGNTNRPIPMGTQIAAQGYLLIVGSSAALQTYRLSIPGISAISLSGFGLTDGGESISLISPFGRLIDEISYNTSWYGDSYYASGGFALEQINPVRTCTGATNWTRTNASAGGTPGSVNSVFNNLPDVTRPSVTGISVLSDMLIVLTFSEPMDTVRLKQNLYTLSGGLVISEKKPSAKGDSLYLTLANFINQGTIYSISGSNATDCSGNLIQPFTRIFVIGKEPSGSEIIINEIMANPRGSVYPAEYIEIYNKSAEVLSLEKVFVYDASTTSNSRSFPKGSYILPGEYLVLLSVSNMENFSSIGRKIGISNFPSLNDDVETISLRNTAGNILDMVSYTKSWYADAEKSAGGWSLERINPLAICSSIFNWKASSSPTGGTPGTINSVYDTAPDVQVPVLQRIVANSENIVQLIFNEPMDKVSLSNGLFFLSENLGVAARRISYNADTLILTLTGTIQVGKPYSLNPIGLKDCALNELATGSYPFGIGRKAGWQDVIINEIFADETPVVGLPDAEYLELYNKTSDVIDLGGDTLKDATSRCIFPKNSTILPNQYLIICSASRQSEFQKFGAVLGLSCFPSLNNTGELLQIIGAGGSAIERVSYLDDWHSAGFSEGGYSLERIDPNIDCRGGANWKSSTSALGGTPGNTNSVFGLKENIPPSILSGFVRDPARVVLVSSEPLDTSVQQATKYSLGAAGPFIHKAALIGTQGDSVLLTLETPLVRSKVYELRVQSVSDCFGNTSQPQVLQIGLGKSPEKFEVVINEILPDENPPVALPEAEFIELYNTTDSLIDLSGCKIADLSGVGRLGTSGVLILPKGYLILASTSRSAAFKRYGPVSAVTNFPSLNSDKDHIRLLHPNGVVLSSVNYSSEWYNDAVKKNGGWSLEKVDPNNPCGGANNWRVSVDERGGTPGAKNSVYALNPDTKGPSVTNVFGLAEDTLLVQFDEIIDSNSVPRATVQISNNLTARILSIGPTQITYRITPPLQKSVTYELVIQNLTDCVGNYIDETTNRKTFTLLEKGSPGDVFVNEILFNPKPLGADFVEIYNFSDKNINLQNWSVANVDSKTKLVSNKKTISSVPFEMPAKTYAVITTNRDAIVNQYPASARSTFITLVSLPTYADREGTVVLLNERNIVMDSVYYHEKYHHELLDAKEGISLEKIDFSLPSNDRNSWQSAAASAGYATPGYLNSQYKSITKTDSPIRIEPLVFTPDGDGQRDFTTIQYALGEGGNTGNITIYDLEGRVIKRLVRNQIMGVEGFYTWNGDDENGNRAPIGYYLVYVEVFNQKGQVKQYKERVVVGGKL